MGVGFWERHTPLSLSVYGHGLLLGGVLAAWLVQVSTHRYFVPLEVIEQPVLAPADLKTIPAARPKPQVEEAKPKPVFGLTRKSLTSETGIEVKAGNTVAKTPDQDKIESDEAALPIPEEEYLVSQMPVLLADVRIPYPSEARKAGIQGVVIFDLLVDADGRVRQAVLVEGPGGGLAEAAQGAIEKLRFKPANVEGRPVAVRIRYAYRFVLEK